MRAQGCSVADSHLIGIEFELDVGSGSGGDG